MSGSIGCNFNLWTARVAWAPALFLAALLIVLVLPACGGDASDASLISRQRGEWTHLWVED